MQKQVNRHDIGKKYENLVAEYFEKNGYRILEQNYRAGKHGEIDLIAEDRSGVLIFCECKYRKNHAYGDPLEAVGPVKQRKICKAALFYLHQKGYGADRACRFDAAAIEGDSQIRHIKNAFEFQIGGL